MSNHVFLELKKRFCLAVFKMRYFFFYFEKLSGNILVRIFFTQKINENFMWSKFEKKNLNSNKQYSLSDNVNSEIHRNSTNIIWIYCCHQKSLSVANKQTTKIVEVSLRIFSHYYCFCIIPFEETNSKGPAFDTDQIEILSSIKKTEKGLDIALDEVFYFSFIHNIFLHFLKFLKIASYSSKIGDKSQWFLMENKDFSHFCQSNVIRKIRRKIRNYYFFE